MMRFVWVFVGWAATIPLISAWLTLLLFLFGCFVGTVDLELVRGGFILKWESSSGLWELTV